MMLVKDGKTEFHYDKYRGHCNGILQQGREVRLNSETIIGKWEFIAKEQSERSMDKKLLRGSIRDKRGSG